MEGVGVGVEVGLSDSVLDGDKGMRGVVETAEMCAMASSRTAVFRNTSLRGGFPLISNVIPSSFPKLRWNGVTDCSPDTGMRYLTSFGNNDLPQK